MNLHQLKAEIEKELKENILPFWINEVYDTKRNTFYGRIANSNEKFENAPFSAVFITRIMWSFSAAYRQFPNEEYKKMADVAFRICMEKFWDSVNGGIYWSVLPNGEMEDSKKQFYAQAFYIYALTEYYLAFKDEKAKQLAISMFMLLENFGFDKEFGGYWEANTLDWKEIEDQRLSPRDLNVKKSMNTHLHILEAYTNLYRIYKDEQLKDKLEHLIRVFLDKIRNKETGHLLLFFDNDWKVRSEIDSYGHDIESTWLLYEAAVVLGNKEILKEVEQAAIKTTDVTIAEGLGNSGGLYYEKDGSCVQDEYHWWPQAEVVIGFFNSWQITHHTKYYKKALSCWGFIQNHIVDQVNGEWFWGVNATLKPLNEDKVGPWKAPYHNARMCLEIIRRIERSEDRGG